MSVFYFVDSLKYLMEKKIRNHCTHLVHLRTLRSKTILHNIPRLNPFVIIIHFCIQKQTKSLDRDYLHYTLGTHYKCIILLLCLPVQLFRRRNEYLTFATLCKLTHFNVFFFLNVSWIVRKIMITIIYECISPEIRRRFLLFLQYFEIFYTLVFFIKYYVCSHVLQKHV